MNHGQGCEHTVVNKIQDTLCKSRAFLKCAALIDQDLPGEMTVTEYIPNGNITCRTPHLIILPSSSFKIASCFPYVHLIFGLPYLL